MSSHFSSLQSFFDSYPGFEFDPLASSTSEWKRLCHFRGWPHHKDQPKHRERNEAYSEFRRTMTEEFNNTFGYDDQNSEAWRRLCDAAGITDVPETLKERKLIMRSTHVNLVDLLDSQRAGQHVEVFDTVEELREYTRRTGKVFPKEEAYAGGLLRYLLREIFGEPEGRSRVRHRR